MYNGDLDICVKCRVGFKKLEDVGLKDFVLVNFIENVNRCFKWRIIGKSC